jgi:outer membrane protein OmpA-like peptidoglycan-associated protein
MEVDRMTKRARLACAVAVAAACLLASSAAGAQAFRFKYAVGDKYKIRGTVEEDVYLNGRMDHRAEFLNTIAVEVKEVRGSSGLVSGTFQTSERRWGSGESFMLSEDYDSEYWRDGRGLYDIDSRLFMPVVRDVPVFPDAEVRPGSSWVADGSEAHDFRRSGIRDPLTFPITVAYRYLRDETVEGRRVAVISIDYAVFHDFRGIRAPASFDPVRVSGYSSQLYYFDVELGQPLSYEEQFTFVFNLSSGDTVEYRGTAQGELTATQALNRQQLAEEIRKALEKEKVPDTTVGVGEKGVTITLENIQFQPDSAVLVAAEKQKLVAIARIIEPIDRDVLIVGHTARVGTEESCQILSEERAQSVGDYLLSLGAKEPTRLVFKGMGSREPIADNATEAGKRRNRRVEITILEN